MVTATQQQYELFLKLCEVEPELRRLAELAWSKRDPGGEVWCPNRIWYDQIKPELKKLVGWGGTNPEVRGNEAYEAAYRVLYDALPGGCRGCACARLEG